MKSERVLREVFCKTNIEIVEMCFEDVKEIKAIEIENKISPWSESDYTNELKRDDSISLVAKTPAKIVGFLIARLITKIDINTNFGGEVEIYNFAVRKKNHRKGIGQTLLDQCLRVANSRLCENIWLDVRVSNTLALNFYMKNSFEIIYRRKGFYNNPVEDAAIMCRKLF